MIKLNFRQRVMFVYGILLFTLGIIISHIDDVIYSCIATLIGVIIIDIIFDKYVMKDTVVLETEENLEKLAKILKEYGVVNE